MAERRGLTVEVFKRSNPNWPDCSNGGVTSKSHTLVVVGTKKGNAPLEFMKLRGMVINVPEEQWPSVVLVDSPRVCLVPLELIEHMPKGHVGPMAGGNVAGTTDSRWSELGLKFGRRLDVVPVHDRIETQEQYNALSI